MVHNNLSGIKLLFETYKRIIKGRYLFKNFLKKTNYLRTGRNEYENNFLVVFPSQDQALSYAGLLYLNSFLSYLVYLRELTIKEQIVSPPVYTKFYIISSDKHVVDSAWRFSKHIVKSELWSAADIENFISYYTVYKPWNIIFASLDRPNGRSCGNLLGKEAIDLRTLVCMGIYGISYEFFLKLKEPEKPVYNGSDNTIKDFMNGK